MAYTTINKSTDHFNTKLYTGNGSTNAITGVGFQPDWVWIKNASSGSNYDHVLYDAVRGVTKHIHSNTTDAEDTQSDGLTAFGTDGFTVGADSKSNSNGSTLVSWNWRASNATAVSNTDGSISSTVSVNDTAGFSIVKYTGTGSAGNVGHGLSTAPKVLINKSISGSNDWFVGHSSIGFTKFLKLNATNASSTNSGIWNDTAPTSSVFTINSANGNTNSTGVEYITYCFAEKKGFSKFESFTGNGSTDGPFVYTGFKPAWVMIKASSRSTDNWVIVDSKRSTLNPADDALLANTSGGTDTGYKRDFLSNGFKIRESGANQNGSGHTFTYMAFAEAPLVGSNNVPCTAR